MSRYYGPQGGSGGDPAAGWTLQRLTPPSDLFGSYGVRMGPDGRLFVAETLSGSVAAVDLETSTVERIVPVGANNLPDDLVFGDDGTMYVADVAPGRVW